MKLDNIYRGDIIKCEGFTGSEPIVRSDSSGRKFYRYGKFDRIYRSNTVLIKIGDDLYIDLLSASMDVSSNFDNIGLYVIPTIANGEDSFYVDEGSLKSYHVNADSSKFTRK